MTIKLELEATRKLRREIKRYHKSQGTEKDPEVVDRLEELSEQKKCLEHRLKAMLSSDFSHWDVQDMNKVVSEAHELVDRGLMTDDDFRDFSYRNVVELYGQVNPDFFKGTRVEAAVEKLKAEGV